MYRLMSLLAGALAIPAMPIPASAQASWQWMASYSNTCTNAFDVCGAVQVGMLAKLDGGTSVPITAEVSTLGNASRLSGSVAISEGASGEFAFGLGPNDLYGCDHPYGGASTCGPDAWLVLSFDVSGSIDARDWTGFYPECYAPGSNPAGTYMCSSFGTPTEMSPVPEPVTLALVGTGLAGLGAFGARRCRRTRLGG
jgi:PEP-CTERM motif